MKRFITAMLTLALVSGLSAGKASAQQAKDQQSIWNDITFNCHATSDLEGIIAIIALAATETGIIDPSDCPRIIDIGECDEIIDPDDCPNLVDLWFELVDAGYTEDEAFEMIEMLMGEDGRYESSQPSHDPVFFTHGLAEATGRESEVDIEMLEITIIHDKSTKQDTIN